MSKKPQPPVFLPLMTRDQPDTSERTRLAVQAVEFAMPAKRSSYDIIAAAFGALGDGEAVSLEQMRAENDARAAALSEKRDG
jgi:hypothetical protein